MLRTNIDAAVRNAATMVDALAAQVTALACPAPDLLAAFGASALIVTEATIPPTLFAVDRESLSEASATAFAAAGSRLSYSGLREASYLRARLARLQAAVTALPASFELQYVTGRLVCQRLGPRMLSGDMPLSVWLAKAITSVVRVEHAQGETAASVQDVEGAADAKHGRR